MVTIYNTTLSATSQRHFSDGLGGGWKHQPTQITASYIFPLRSVLFLDWGIFVVSTADLKQLKHKKS